MPNQPKTPTRSLRIPEDTWGAVVAMADDRGLTATDVVLAALWAYLPTCPDCGALIREASWVHWQPDDGSPPIHAPL
jgi:hypothetical protein